MKKLIWFILAIVLAGALAACGGGGGSDSTIPKSVDLRPQQTSFQPQGNRTTCITFSALAALEAAYKEAGYGDLDLSEEFLNHVGKMNWLHPYWSELVDKGADYTENQVAAFGGGGGPFYVEMLAKGLVVPLESALPYQSSAQDLTGYCATCDDYKDPYWKVQHHADDFNLDPAVLLPDALVQEQYYSVLTYKEIGAKDVNAFETALREGNEVVWDFRVAGTRGNDMWVPSDGPYLGDHSMLIVGYDRTDASNPFFIVKNSWGATSAGTDGWTRISYDYVLEYGVSAAYIETVAPPAPRPELAFLGRWNLSFDGHKGVLDIYHIPGLAQPVFDKLGVDITDRRIGVFYDANGDAFRVNGSIVGNKIDFYFDGAEPNLSWDKLQGRHFTYMLFKGDSAYGGDAEANVTMAGIHTDPDGRQWMGYARKEGYLDDPVQTPRPLEASSYLGRWRLNFNGLTGYLTLDTLDNSVPGISPGLLGLSGVFDADFSTVNTYGYAYVSAADPAEVIFATGIGGYEQLTGRILTWDNGIVAGYVNSVENGFYAVQETAHPTVTITVPSDNSTVYTSAADSNGTYALVNLTAQARDYQNQTLSGANVVWEDSIDGGATQVIGTGTSLTGIHLYGPAAIGTWVHTITVTVTDGNGLSWSDTITINVTIFG